MQRTTAMNDSAIATRPAPTAPDDRAGEKRLLAAIAGVVLVVFATALDTKLLGLIQPSRRLLWGSAAVAGVGCALLWMPTLWRVWPRGAWGKRGWAMFSAQLIVGFAFGGVIAVVSAAKAQDLEKPLMSAWNRARADFERSSQGFPVIEALGKEYGVDVELADEEGRYQTTTHVGPNASPGQMEIYPGYCELGIWPVGVARDFPSGFGGASIPADRMLLGVAVHEFGHCLDMSRDQPTFADSHVGVASIAPSARAQVHDLKTYLRATKALPTKLWREVYADLFAIGFAKLKWRDAAAFDGALVDARVMHESEDPVHATACWDRWALKQTPPDNVLGLRAWADTMRSSAPCTLPAR
jgi:hypothetical protein